MVMFFLNQSKRVQSNSRSRSLFTSSAAAVLTSVAFMAVAQTASAQVTVEVDDCADFPIANPAVGAGAVVNVNAGVGTCTLTTGDHIELEDNSQDDTTINIASGVSLVNTDTSDEDVVIFIDNSEDNTTINVANGATLSGADGVIFVEGDGARIVNSGDIIGTGEQTEGVIYIDRDTDGVENRIINTGTGQIIAQDNGPAIGIEALIADGTDNTSDIGVQQPLEDFPNVRIVNRAGGLIQTTGSSSDDNDAINVAGNPGNTGGDFRTCIEGTAVHCQVNLRVLNFGTIQSVFDNSSTAGITVEDDAVFNGAILNNLGGVITGVRNGVRIGDAAVQEDGTLAILTAQHTGIIRNRGTISGTGASSRGIDLEGDGVTISNTATGTISGLSIGIEVGAGSSTDSTSTSPSGAAQATIDHTGLNNRIINSGTISGGNQSIDSQNAEGAVQIDSYGGVFDGNIRGSVVNVDILRIANGTTNLTHNVLQNFSVRVNSTGTLNFVGDRTIEGDVFGRGTFGFDVSDTQTITGDLNLRAGSTVAITDTSGISSLGANYTLADVGGTLTNDAVLDTTDSSLLLDFIFVDSADLVVEAVAAGGGMTKSLASKVQFTNAAAESFGTTVLDSFVEGGLNETSAFSNLVALSSGESVGLLLESLAPDFSGSVAQNIYSSVQNGKTQIAQRLNDLDCNQFYDGRETSTLNISGVQGCQSFAQTGSWVQVATPETRQGSLSLSAPSSLNAAGNNSITMTYGYDQAVDNDTVVGITGSYTRTEADNEAFSVSGTDLDVMQFSAYAGHRIGNMNFITKASFSSGEAETRRQSYEVIRADVGFRGLNVESVASYDVNLGKGFYMKPEAGFLYDNLTTDAYTEVGGLNLDVSKTGSNVLDARMGVTLGARRQISDSLRADVYVSGAVVDDVYGQRDNVEYSVAGQFGSLNSRQLDNFAVQGLMGVNLLSSDKFSFGAALNSEFSGTETAIGTSVQTKLRW